MKKRSLKKLAAGVLSAAMILGTMTGSMAVSAEVAKSPLFNFVVPNISPIMNGSKIDTLYTYTEGQPVYYYYIYAINYNFLLFSNGMCGLKYS